MIVDFEIVRMANVLKIAARECRYDLQKTVCVKKNI